MSGTKPFEYGILIQFKRYTYTVQIAIDIDSAAIAKRQTNNERWHNWDFYVTKSDLDASVKTTNLSAGKDVRLFVGELNGSQNYLQFLIDGVDKGYIVFDVSRNINT